MKTNFDWIQFGAGMVNMRNRRYKAAENQFKKLLSRNPVYGYAYAQLGILKKRIGKLDEANSFFNKAIIHLPDQGIGIYYRGVVYVELESFDSALNQFEKLFELNSSNIDAMLNMALIYGRKGNYDEAKKIITGVYDKDADKKDGFSRLGWIKAEDKDWSNAHEIMNRDWESKRLSPGWQVNFAQMVGRKGEFSRAMELIDKAYSANPDLKDGYARLGWIKTETQDWSSALDLMNKDSKLDRISPAWKVNLAQLYGRCGKWEIAIELIDKAYSANPDLKDGYARLGWIKTETQDWSSALDLMNKDSKLDRISPAWKVNLAQLYGRCGKWEIAIELIDKAYSINPDLKNGYARLGWIKTENQKWCDAIDIMEKDVFYDRISWFWKINLAILFVFLGKIDIAANEIDRVYKQSNNATDGLAKVGWCSYLYSNDDTLFFDYLNRDMKLARLSFVGEKLRAVAMCINGRYEELEILIGSIYRNNQNDKNGFAVIGWQLIKMGKSNKGMYYMEKDYSLKRLSTEWKINYSYQLAKGGNYKKAQLLFKEVLREKIIKSINVGYQIYPEKRYDISDFKKMIGLAENI